jgi:hypothetical protein
VACDAMLMAEATREASLALLAKAKGAEARLRELITHWTPHVRAAQKQAQLRTQKQEQASVSDHSNGLSYAGAPAPERLLTACTQALAR